MIMLDMTACIDFLKGDPSLKQKMETIEANLFVICSVVIYELSIGLQRTKRKMGLKRYNNLLQKWQEFRANLKIFDIDLNAAEKAAEIYDKLESKGQIIDDNDCLITGIMQTNNIGKIITRNRDHFNRIDGIEIIDY